MPNVGVSHGGRDHRADAPLIWLIGGGGAAVLHSRPGSLKLNVYCAMEDDRGCATLIYAVSRQNAAYTYAAQSVPQIFHFCCFSREGFSQNLWLLSYSALCRRSGSSTMPTGSTRAAPPATSTTCTTTSACPIFSYYIQQYPAYRGCVLGLANGTCSHYMQIGIGRKKLMASRM